MDNTQINYQQVILDLLNNNAITSPPPKEVLNLSEDIALALWKNFESGSDYYDNFDALDWYKEGNWNDLLSGYKENIGFWEKALDMKRYKDEILIFTSFREEFPIVAQHFLGTEEKLVSLLNQTKNIEFFHMIQKLNVSKERQEEIYIDYVMKNTYEIDDKTMQNYSSKPDVIKKLLGARPNSYLYLSKQDQKNDDYIKIAMKDENVLFSLPSNKRQEYFGLWLQNQQNMTLQLFKRLDNDERLEVMNKNIVMMANILQNQTEQYIGMVKKFCQNNPEIGIEYLPTKYINQVYSSDMKQKMFDSLENYVNNYDSIDGFTKSDINKIMIISHFPGLHKKLHNNKVFALNDKCYYDQKKRILKSDFEEMFELLEEKYNKQELTYEECENKLNKLKGRINIPQLKEAKYPGKNLFNYLIKEKLNSNLKENLEDKHDSGNRFKL